VEKLELSNVVADATDRPRRQFSFTGSWQIA
jgi:hypothetical protein